MAAVGQGEEREQRPIVIYRDFGVVRDAEPLLDLWTPLTGVRISASSSGHGMDERGVRATWRGESPLCKQAVGKAPGPTFRGSRHELGIKYTSGQRNHVPKLIGTLEDMERVWFWYWSLVYIEMEVIEMR